MLDRIFDLAKIQNKIASFNEQLKKYYDYLINNFGLSNYKVNKILPKEIKDSLPAEEDINMHVDIDNKLEKN